LPLHLISDGFGAVVAIGSELGGLGGKRLELLA
jgi:hypothetical protein